MLNSARVLLVLLATSILLFILLTISLSSERHRHSATERERKEVVQELNHHHHYQQQQQQQRHHHHQQQNYFGSDMQQRNSVKSHVILPPRIDESVHKLTLFLPMVADDFARFSLMVKSMLKFLDFEKSVSEWIIVVPDADLEVLRHKFFKTNEPEDDHSLCNLELGLCLSDVVHIELVSESELIPGLHNGIDTIHSSREIHDKEGKASRKTNWMLQQILKLYAGQVCRTRFVLILDTDLLMIQPATYNDLVIPHGSSPFDSRAINNLQIYVRGQANWMHSSIKVLGMEPQLGDGKSLTAISVTPQILSTHILRDLAAHLQNMALSSKQFNGVKVSTLRPRQSLDDITTIAGLGNYAAPLWLYPLIVGEGWTEFTLYSAFATATGQMYRYHEDKPSMGLLALDNSVWSSESVGRFDFNALFTKKQKNYFSVIQSTVFVDADRYIDQVLPHIDSIAAARRKERKMLK